MKAILMLFIVSMTSFAPASQQVKKAAAIDHAVSDPFPCRVAFLLNFGTTTAVVKAQTCDGTPVEYTIPAGQFVNTACLSTAYGTIVEGSVVVDWGMSCQ